MKFNVQEWANKLKVVSVFQPGNESGIVTDRRLYDPNFPGNRAPVPAPYEYFIRHVTVGVNSLSWLAGGSIPETWASVNMLIPRGMNFTVYKLFPDNFRGNHVGDAEWMGRTEGYIAPRAYGVEWENRANGTEAVDQSQYIKGALIYAYWCAENKTLDRKVLDHSLIAIPHGRRMDPQAGLWSDQTFWDCVAQIRRAWPTNWPFPVWWGGSQPD